MCERYHLPIISDEIYADMVFTGHTFTPLANVRRTAGKRLCWLTQLDGARSLSRTQLSTTVPILTTGGIAKRYMVPGWRLGWVLVHDRQGLFRDVRAGLVRLSQIILGANSLVQAALPDLLEATDAAYYAESIKQLEVRAAQSPRAQRGPPHRI